MENLIQIPEPKISRFLFADTRAAWFWLIIRLYVGYVWLMAGYEKFSNPAWVGDNAGTAIKGFFVGALAKATGQYPQVSSWYASFITGFAMPNAVLFLLQLFLILAWRNAGWIGLDRYALPKLGVPWAPGSLFNKSIFSYGKY